MVFTLSCREGTQMEKAEVELQAFLTSTVGGSEWSFTPRKELAVSIEKEAGWAPAQFWAVWRRDFFDPAGTRTQDRVPTTLTRHFLPCLGIS
jgi:hypothetical protein